MIKELEKAKYNDVYNDIKKIMEKSKESVVRTVNSTLVRTNWEIGRLIIEDEKNHGNRAEYGKYLVDNLSAKLTKEYGRGFSRSNLFNMRNLYLKYPTVQTLSGQLTWSHYCELLGISDDNKRSSMKKKLLIRSGVLEN